MSAVTQLAGATFIAGAVSLAAGCQRDSGAAGAAGRTEAARPHGPAVALGDRSSASAVEQPAVPIEEVRAANGWLATAARPCIEQALGRPPTPGGRTLFFSYRLRLERGRARPAEVRFHTSHPSAAKDERLIACARQRFAELSWPTSGKDGTVLVREGLPLDRAHRRAPHASR
jgi:hypothetical protein